MPEELPEVDALGLKWDSREGDDIVLAVETDGEEEHYALSPEQVGELSDGLESLQMMRRHDRGAYAYGTLQEEV